MSNTQLRAATAAAKEPKGFLELIESMKPEIARALPRHINPDRMARIATTEWRKNPKLGECEIRSVFGAIITLSQLGLEPGVQGQAYLIPYGNVCTAIPGWKGIADLVARAGRASVWTGAVYEGDHFDYAFGDRPHVTHRPSDEDDGAPGEDKLTHVYAVGRIKGAEWPVIEVWSAAKAKKHRDRYNKVGAKHYSFQHFEMYARKVVLLQVMKYMPQSIELQRALDLAEAADKGVTIDMSKAASGWVPPANGDTPAPTAPDKAASIEQIKAAATLQALEDAYQPIVAAYVAANEAVPVEVEGAYNDRKAAIEQKV
jgi:recombination protein RecT